MTENGGRSVTSRYNPPRRAALVSARLLRALWLSLFIGSACLDGDATGLHAEPLVQADEIIVVKSERMLHLLRQGDIIKSYWIALGRYPTGPKTKVGDGRTPEGTYWISSRDANSQFHRSLLLSYPNREDQERARRLGVEPGGQIMIHAVPKGYGPTGPGERMIDWTNGCIAVTNADMDEIWARVPVGTRVVIRP
jgi:murein L,D-transpeptidase YafK